MHREDQRGAQQERGAGAIWLTILGYLTAAIYGLHVIGLVSAVLLLALSLEQLLSTGTMLVELLLSMAAACVFYRGMMGAKSGIDGGPCAVP